MKRDLSSFSADGFDRGASRFQEALWWIVRAVIFLPPIPFPSSLKVLVLRWFGAEVGDEVVIRPGCSISFPWRVEIGDHVWLGEEVRILSLAKVTIGSHSCISQQAFLCTGSHDQMKASFDLITEPITLGESAWIGARAFISPGVRIGEGTTIGACAVVTKDQPAYILATGNPAEKKRDL